MITSINEFRKINENGSSNIYYHGSTDTNMSGEKGIHVGTYKAAKQALEARIGVPAVGEWDGTREYGKTLLAGRKTLERIEKEEKRYVITGFNCSRDIPNEDYFPTDREERAEYSNKAHIPFDCKPIIFKVVITGKMSNTPSNPHNDIRANSMMLRNLKQGNAKSGYYYINDGEDYGSISAVVPNKTFLKIVE
jgi:hypothetical protein